MHLSTMKKALAAFLFAAAATLGASMLDGDLTTREAVNAAGVALVTAGGVYVTPRNADPARFLEPRHVTRRRRDPFAGR